MKNNNNNNVDKTWNPNIAALLSFLIPGTGQIYKGYTLEGICWFLSIAYLYFFSFNNDLNIYAPWMISSFMHLMCIAFAQRETNNSN